METKKFIVIVSILSFGIWLSLWFLLQTPQKTINPEHQHVAAPMEGEYELPHEMNMNLPPARSEQKKQPAIFRSENTLNYTEIFSQFLKDENLWVPEDWTGLPLSKENHLFVEYKKSPSSLDKFNEFLDILKQFDAIGWNTKDDVWTDLVHQYSPLIGWNGVFDAVEKAEENIGVEFPRRLHTLGEILATEDVRGKYMIEITSRDMLHKAPMHGAVWSIINEVGTENLEELLSVVDDELCFFKNYPTMGNIWISCAHGVGHGLAQLYGKEEIPAALDVCDVHPDSQFKYACATGIYMALESEFLMTTFAPCDTNRFAAACFRFKNKMSKLLFTNVSDPCVTQRTPYHRRACIWGFAYIAPIPNPILGLDVCEPYRPFDPTEQPAANDYAACLDGFWGSHELAQAPARVKPPTFCDVLREYEKAHEICEYYLTQSLRLFSFEDDEVFFYNTELLEEYFTPEVLNVEPATLLPEWKLDISTQLQQIMGSATNNKGNNEGSGGHQH